MNTLTIHTPIWKTLSIGISTRYCNRKGILKIEIDYTNKQGQRLFPHPFYIEKNKIREYPTQIRKKTILHIVPIKELKGSIKNELF